MTKHTGSCLCGAVAFEIEGPLRDVTYCHCSQCRKVTGHHMAATSAPLSAIRMLNETGLAWYRSSGEAQRGFCKTCGATLFWKPDDEARYAIAAGSLDLPTGLKAVKHIYVADKGDYYAIADGLPEFEAH
jgi:hypothetical protein